MLVAAASWWLLLVLSTRHHSTPPAVTALLRDAARTAWLVAYQLSTQAWRGMIGGMGHRHTPDGLRPEVV